MRRPFLLYPLLVFTLASAAYNAWGVVSGWQRYAFLTTLPLAVAPAYLILHDLVGLLFFGAVSVGLWLRQRWAWFGLLAGFPLYLAWTWVDRLTWARADFLRMNWPFALAWDLALAVGMVAVLWLLRNRLAAPTNPPDVA